VGGFTYQGQSFGYGTAPVITATAVAAGGTTTTNYTNGAFFKLSNATLTFSSGTGLKFVKGAPVAPFDANMQLAINVIDADGVVHSAVNDPNVYSGPGTGYRLEGERWQLLQSLPQVVAPAELLGEETGGAPIVEERGAAAKGVDVAEVVVAVGPAFADAIRRTIADLDHRDVLEAVCDGIRKGGAEPRLVRVRRVADVAFIGHDGARLSGSGVAIGIQSKGTAVIHRADLEPLDNLELFGMSPLYTLESYCAMGRNAAGYALGKRVGPVPTQLDNFARAKLIVRTTLLHARETQAVVPGAEPVELELLLVVPAT